MFTLTSYLKKAQEGAAGILREADAIRAEKSQLTKPIAERVEKRFFQDPQQIKQLCDFIKNKEIPFVENIRDDIKKLIGQKHRLAKLLEKSGKKDLIIDIEWLWKLFKGIKPEIINIHSRVRKEEYALRKEDFKQFVEIYKLEQDSYSKIDQITSQYPRIGLDVYRKTNDDKVLLLSKIGGSTLKRVTAIIMISLCCVTAQAASYTETSEIEANKKGDRVQEPLYDLFEFREGFTQAEIDKAINVFKKIIEKCGSFKYHIVFTKSAYLAKQAGGEASTGPIYNGMDLWGFHINISPHLENEQLTDEEKYEFIVAHEAWHCIEEYTDTSILNKEMFLLDSPFYKGVDLFEELKKFKKGEIPAGFVSFYAKFGYAKWLLRNKPGSYYSQKPSIKNVVREDEAETFAYLVLGHNYASRDPIVRKKLGAFEKFFRSINKDK